MSFTVQQIAEALGAQAAGDTSITITGAAEPADARPTDLALASTPAYAEKLALGAARAAMLWQGADWQALGLQAAIFAPRPRMAMSGLTAKLDPGQGFGEGIHPSAVIDPTATIAPGVSVGPFTVIGAQVEIGEGSVIGPQCFIGQGARIGPNAYLRDKVSIGARCTIGARFIAQPGAVIGGDGFSFVTPEVSGVEMARKTLGDQGDAAAQAWARIHSLGAVTIGDDVEVGALVTIDSGTIRDTVIGSGSKLDSQGHVGHNVRIGRDCLLCGQAGIAGSTVLGDNVVLGGQAGVSDNLKIGNSVIATGGTKILSNVPDGRVMMGFPAVKMDTHTEMYKASRRLPRLARDVDALKKKAVPKDGASD